MIFLVLTSKYKNPVGDNFFVRNFSKTAYGLEKCFQQSYENAHEKL
jgi:hypothetical protein